MKQVVIVDTDIVIEYLKTGKGILPVAYEKHTMHLSVVAFTELLASKTFEDANLKKEVLEFVEKYFTLKEVNKEIAEEAARLLREHKINLATAMIAATSIITKNPVIANDKEAYKKLGVDVIEVQ